MIDLMASRRNFLIGSAGGGLLLLSPALSWAQDAQPRISKASTRNKDWRSRKRRDRSLCSRAPVRARLAC